MYILHNLVEWFGAVVQLQTQDVRVTSSILVGMDHCFNSRTALGKLLTTNVTLSTQEMKGYLVRTVSTPLHLR